jgi:two-component system, OmpR family, response regulator VicR
MFNAHTFLIVDDNEEIIEAIKLTLMVRWPEAKLVSAKTGVEGLALAGTEKPDLVLLDLGLPGLNGFEVIKHLRSNSRTPIIVVTVRNEESDIVKALELGANDYIIKPFRQMELLSRVNNQIRVPNSDNTTSPLFCGRLSLHLSNHEAYFDSKRVNLTPIEANLLAILMRNAGQTVTHASLAVEAWGEFYPESSRILKVHICRLRQKLEANPSDPKLVLTQTGVGYRFIRPECA